MFGHPELQFHYLVYDAVYGQDQHPDKHFGIELTFLIIVQSVRLSNATKGTIFPEMTASIFSRRLDSDPPILMTKRAIVASDTPYRRMASVI